LSLETKQHTFASEGDEALTKLNAFWDRYGRILLGVIAVIAVVGVGAFYYLRGRGEQEAAAAGKLAEASLLYWQGDYARSTDLAKQVSTQYGATTSGADAHRLLGDNAFWSGDFKTAITEYRTYVAKAPAGVLQDSGRRSLAYALESSGATAEAAQTYESLVGKIDRSSSGEFLYAAARCYLQMGQPAQALDRLKRLEAEFGETSYAAMARMKIAELEAAAGH
jgi:predicted negative regulator of RcsB-dependent stress response